MLSGRFAWNCLKPPRSWYFPTAEFSSLLLPYTCLTGVVLPLGKETGAAIGTAAAL